MLQPFLNSSPDNPRDSPFESIRNRGGGEAKKGGNHFIPATAVIPFSWNGQPRGGGFTGGVSQSSRSSTTVHAAHGSREAELLQLQRSDTRWCHWFTFHLGAREGQTVVWLRSFERWNGAHIRASYFIISLASCRLTLPRTGLAPARGGGNEVALCAGEVAVQAVG